MDKKDTKARFINFEGITHSGKTKQAKELVGFLGGRSGPKAVLAVLNVEPTRGVFGRIIRELIERRRPSVELVAEARGLIQYSSDVIAKLMPSVIVDILDKVVVNKELSEIERQLLFFADRVDDVLHNIKPVLASGQWVIQDRFDLSTFAYGMSAGLTFEELAKWHDVFIAPLKLKPDLLVFIDAPPEEAFGRIRKDAAAIRDIYEETLRKLEKTYRIYRSLIDDEEKIKRFCHQLAIIDGRLSISEIATEVGLVSVRYFGF